MDPQLERAAACAKPHVHRLDRGVPLFPHGRRRPESVHKIYLLSTTRRADSTSSAKSAVHSPYAAANMTRYTGN